MASRRPKLYDPRCRSPAPSLDWSVTVSESAPEHRLVVYQEGVDPHLIRDILAAELALHATDAMRLAAHAPGVIPVALTARQSAALAQRLTEAAVDAEDWLAERLPDLSQPRDVYRVRCRPQGLEVTDRHSSPEHWLPWEQVELISVGVVPQGVASRQVNTPTWLAAATTGIRVLGLSARAPRSRSIKVARPPAPELWIVRERPVLALRLQPYRMNFDYLGERLQSNTAANFRLLIEDVLRPTPGATITPATHSFLTYDRPGHHFFSSAQELMEYTTWQLLLRWRSRRREADDT